MKDVHGAQERQAHGDRRAQRHQIRHLRHRAHARSEGRRGSTRNSATSTKPRARRSRSCAPRRSDVVVALTHLEREDDEMLIRSLADYGLDLLVGGHDHARMTIKDASGKTRGFKAESDAKTAWLIKVRVPAKGKVDIRRETLVPLDGTKPETAPTRTIEKLAAKWSAAGRGEAVRRAQEGRAGNPTTRNACRSRPGPAQFAIRLEEQTTGRPKRNSATGSPEVVRKATGADVAIVDAGILGLNTNLEAGSQAAARPGRRTSSASTTSSRCASVAASVVCAAIRHGFGKPGTGAWPHVSGLKADGSSSNAEGYSGRNGRARSSALNGSQFDCTNDATR